MRKVIRLGDPTSHGGFVISVSATDTIMGIRVARKGDLCSCPIKGHGVCTIVEGDPNDRIDGIEVAYEGHLTSCGAALMGTVENVGCQ